MLLYKIKINKKRKILMVSCHLFEILPDQPSHLMFMSILQKIWPHFIIKDLICRQNDLPKVTKLVSGWTESLILITMFLHTPAVSPFTII